MKTVNLRRTQNPQMSYDESVQKLMLEISFPDGLHRISISTVGIPKVTHSAMKTFNSVRTQNP